MGFYEALSNYYHLIFPPQPAQLQFLTSQFTRAGEGKKILDVACATGGYSFALAGEGFTVVAFDLEENMIKLAQERQADLQQGTAAEREVSRQLAFHLGDMRQAARFGNDFQGLFCIGNSLAHLTGRPDLEQAAAGFYQALLKGGVAIVQVVNFDRILKYRVDSLPTIQREGASLVRRYCHLDSGLIDFQTVLTVKAGEKQEEYHHSVQLRPLLKRELAEIFAGAGFNQLTFYGGFDGQEHSQESQALVMVAVK